MFEKNNIKPVRIGEKVFIKKLMLNDITMEMCLSKKKFVDYLLDSSIPTAAIIGYDICNGRIVETQEFIENLNTNYIVKDYIRLIARFHRVSRDFLGEIVQKPILNNGVEIDNNFLKQTLIGFEEKYYLYARDSFNNNCKNEKIKSILTNMHEKIYKEFMNVDDTKRCIIHNDLTSDNIIKNKHLYLIDFDLAVKSSVYVDFADVIFPRKLEMFDYLNYIRDNSYIKSYVDYYNQFNNNTERLCVHGVKLMAALKIFTYVMYIYSQNNVVSEELCLYLCTIGREVIGG